MMLCFLKGLPPAGVVLVATGGLAERPARAFSD